MSAALNSVDLLGTLSKHHVGGIVGIIIGVVIVVLGGMRVAAHVAGAMIVPIAGLVIVVLGILLYAHVI